MSLWCWLFGHDWEYQPGAVPEDRESYKCGRCGDWGLHPPDYDQDYIPEEDRVRE